MVRFSKLIHLLVPLLFLCLANDSFSQKGFSMRGQLMVDKKIIVGAHVIVYDGNNVVMQTSTDQLGKFWVDLNFQKVYVLQFKKKEIPTQKVVVSTMNKDLKGDYYRSKVVVFSLSSSKPSNEGPGTSGAVATFTINDKGVLEQENLLVDEPVRIKDDKEEVVENKITELEKKTEELITNLPESEKSGPLADYKSIMQKKDSILLLAELQASMILKAAQKQSVEIAEKEFPVVQKTPNEKKSIIKSNTEIKEDLRKLSVEEKTFFEREDVKAYQKKIDRYNSKEKLTKNDSVDYFSTVLQMNEEMVKSARLQLEIDKLNARTKEDSLIIQQRESEIMLAEQEIKEAKTQIEIQKLVIKQKNTMLMFSVSAMLFFVILSIMIYKSWRDKKRTNAILEKQNLEIANKNKKIIDSIRYAQTIQQAILPIGTTIDKYFDWFIIYQPKDIVSGDFYWFTHIEETGKSIFAVVDCTGHGVPGAFMSMIGNRLLIEAVKEKGITRPVEILNDVDASIRIALMQDETLNNDGMDMCICTVEYAKNGKCLVEFAGAKRPIFYSEAKGGLKHIKGTVRGIGGKKRIREKAIKPFEEHVLKLHKGDMIYLTTDGFFDLQSSDRKKFGRLNFMEILEKNYSQNPEYQRIAIMDALHLHLGAENQIDDITIMGIKL